MCSTRLINLSLSTCLYQLVVYGEKLDFWEVRLLNFLCDLIVVPGQPS